MFPIEIEYVKPYDTETEWETTKETSKFLKLNKAALKAMKLFLMIFMLMKIMISFQMFIFCGQQLHCL